MIRLIEPMKANLLLKHNIDALLKGRGQTRRDLAQWCRQTTDGKVDTWISHIFGAKGYTTREIPLKYLDRIADFFGLATYQLFAPGISPLTERRGGRDRRTGRDRRISQKQYSAVPAHTPDLETVTPWERAHLARVRRLDAEARKNMEYLIDLALQRAVAPRTEELPAEVGTGLAPSVTTPHTPTRRKLR